MFAGSWLPLDFWLCGILIYVSIQTSKWSDCRFVFLRKYICYSDRFNFGCGIYASSLCEFLPLDRHTIGGGFGIFGCTFYTVLSAHLYYRIINHIENLGFMSMCVYVAHCVRTFSFTPVMVSLRFVSYRFISYPWVTNSLKRTTYSHSMETGIITHLIVYMFADKNQFKTHSETYQRMNFIYVENFPSIWKPEIAINLHNSTLPKWAFPEISVI